MSAHQALPSYPERPLPSQARLLSRRLLTWFRRARRDLPWRQTRDPYAIWVSEIMLQQTQVATVIPYFHRFLAAFPTLAYLAAADEADVLRLWEGLGYYRRARELHRAARLVIAEHDGEMPRDVAQLRRLPGIGRYTAGAVLSQAFDQRLPIVEANSARVLCRLFACGEKLGSTAVERWLWSAAEALLPAKRVGEFNQAIMELGALVCTPRQPDCGHCPLARLCLAHARSLQDSLPVKAKPAATVTVQEVAIVIDWDGRVLLCQRPDKGRWANLWEFPHGPIKEDESARAAAQRVIRELTCVSTRLGKQIGVIDHSITRYAVSMRCFVATCLRNRFSSGFYHRAKWLHLDELDAYPMSTPQRELVRLFAEKRGKR